MDLTLFFTAAIIVLLVLLLLCLIRGFIGPRIADRLIAVNAGTTITVAIVAIVAIMLGEGYYTDIAVIYAILSFMSVVVFTRVYLGVYRKRKAKEAEKHE